jgi:hypothetical protein
MGRLGMAFAVGLACAVPAAAADFPTRKAGLWEMTTTSNGRAMLVKQCIDAATDQAMQANANLDFSNSSSLWRHLKPATGVFRGTKDKLDRVGAL